ncbi:inorganic phosphate transporter, partial [Acidianus sp. RZ1]|uniref:inorganic phosphate transporter n=1 Tax=Acidianus sp. RZ1 TaxID=1540082 RepID=UPI001492BD12
MEILSLLIFIIGIISSFIVGGNNSATAIGILLSTNALKKRQSYLVSAISIFLGTSLGSYTLRDSVYGLVHGNVQNILYALIFSAVFASVVSFYYLNKSGIPSSLSQMIYPSLAVMVVISKGLLFNWEKFWFTVASWGF